MLPYRHKHTGTRARKRRFNEKLLIFLSSVTIIFLFAFIVLCLKTYKESLILQNFIEHKPEILTPTNKKLLSVEQWPLYTHITPDDFESIKSNGMWVNMHLILQKSQQDACQYRDGDELVYKVQTFPVTDSQVTESSDEYGFQGVSIPADNIVPDPCIKWPLYTHINPERFESIERDEKWVNMNSITLQKSQQEACQYSVKGELVYKVEKFPVADLQVTESWNHYTFKDLSIIIPANKIVLDPCVKWPIYIGMNSKIYEQRKQYGWLVFSRFFAALPADTPLETTCGKLTGVSNHDIMVKIEKFDVEKTQIHLKDVDGIRQYNIQATDLDVFVIPYGRTSAVSCLFKKNWQTRA